MRSKMVSKRVTQWIRIHRLTLLITGIMLLFICRLSWLQFIQINLTNPNDSHSMISQSIIQRERGIELDSGRGQIVDRDGIPITGQSIQALVLFPVHASSVQDEALDSLSSILRIKPDRLKDLWLQTKEPIIWPDAHDGKRVKALTHEEATSINQQEWKGVQVLPYTERYPWGEQTPHWIGYTIAKQQVSDQGHQVRDVVVGAYGLERAFDPFLKSIGSSTYVHYMDAARKPLTGLGIRLSHPDNPYYPLRLVTTTDMGLHNKIAELMDKHHVDKGAVVVLDVNTRDVVAMVSRPAYDPYHIQPEHTDWNNQALHTISPGSVFKLVIAAAALETGVTTTRETFTCDGEYHKFGLSCWKKGGHGQLTLDKALAESCNVVFATLGERLSSKVIDEYATKLGLTGSVGMVTTNVLGHESLPHFDLEEAGRVFLSNTHGQVITDGGIRAQAAIGQRDVRITPLAAANAFVTLIKLGYDGHPRLVSHIEDAKGNRLVSFTDQSKIHAVIKPQTAQLLMSWMRQVVTDGTGIGLKDSLWPLAGKSGTAQGDRYGVDRMHSWFVGFGPYAKPKYVVAVVSEDEYVGHEHKAAVVFKEVMQELSKAN